MLKTAAEVCCWNSSSMTLLHCTCAVVCTSTMVVLRVHHARVIAPIPAAAFMERPNGAWMPAVVPGGGARFHDRQGQGGEFQGTYIVVWVIRWPLGTVRTKPISAHASRQAPASSRLGTLCCCARLGATCQWRMPHSFVTHLRCDGTALLRPFCEQLAQSRCAPSR